MSKKYASELQQNLRGIEGIITGIIESEVTRRVAEQLAEGVIVQPVADDIPMQQYGGDANKAQGKFFRFVIDGERVTIYCPTFLRGRLTFHARDGKICGASY